MALRSVKGALMFDGGIGPPMAKEIDANDMS